MNETLKRYLISSGVTFLVGFLTVFSASLNTLNLETLTTGVLLGVFLAALRAGVKGLVELSIVWVSDLKK